MHRLGTLSDDFTWKDSVNPNYPGGRAFLFKEIAPLGTYTFKFTITAPTTVGMHSLETQMVQDGVKWFGTKLYCDIIVVNSVNATVNLSATGVVTSGSTNTSYNSQIHINIQIDAPLCNGTSIFKT